MEYRHLGRSGLRVSKLCLGTMVGFKHKDQESASRIVTEAEKAASREISITHEDLRQLQSPIADYLHVTALSD